MSPATSTPSLPSPARRRLLRGVPAAAAAIGLPLRAQPAAEPLKIGLIASWSGPYADYGRQFDAGIAVWLQEHGGRIAGRPVALVRRDTAGPAPELARRAAQELLIQDRVQVLGGLDFSPNASAVAPVATQARVPLVVMNAASAAIPSQSPYVVRTSFTVQQVSGPMGRWAAKQGIGDAWTVVADYASGLDAEGAFRDAFTAAGGRIAGSSRVPMGSLDFSAYLQRVRDAKPQAVFFFFPSGVMPPAFLRAWKERAMDQAGIRLLATGEATDDSYLAATGDAALGLVTSHHYSFAHPSDKNRIFIQRFRALHGPKLRPSYFAVAAYDGLAAIEAALTKTGGDAGGDKLVAAMRGMAFESPRGPIEIDAATRDIVQTVYIRRVERQVDGELVNREFDRYERVRYPA
ncbi:ABC transporter substrate-binding protein [uncultured Xylophilus sp.]|uniref:ABC transporter substrate-binding protein n=1 Tax=uncultured Xylophilus sp. TaxID=296832 RepID=UPI0025CBBB64|nr:ABC transporter substrate-binding protein [uncultured Xylophilus sp.]